MLNFGLETGSILTGLQEREIGRCVLMAFLLVKFLHEFVQGGSLRIQLFVWVAGMTVSASGMISKVVSIFAVLAIIALTEQYFVSER